MESITRSPIFSDFSEVLEGIVTVRAFGVEGKFMGTMFERVDLTTKVCRFALVTLSGPRSVDSKRRIRCSGILDDMDVEPLVVSSLRRLGSVGLVRHL